MNKVTRLYEVTRGRVTFIHRVEIEGRLLEARATVEDGRSYDTVPTEYIDRNLQRDVLREIENSIYGVPK